MVDVARAAGVSRTTASLVLNDRVASIPEDTRQRVRIMAERMGYRPNSTALALATGRTHRIGIILNQPESFNTDDHYFATVLKGVTLGALRYNYNLLLHSAHYTDWRAMYDDILSGASDGTLLVGRYVHDQLTPELLDTGQPCVCISYHMEHPRCHAVDCDNEQGGCLAAQHLIKLGHRHIAVFYPGEEASWGRERRAGVEQAMMEAGLPITNLKIFPWSETTLPQPKWVERAVEFLASTSPHVTAAICCDEFRAVGLADALVGMGKQIPEELALISFNSTDLSARARPPLTSVWQPLEQIGTEAVSMLVDLIEKRTPRERIQRLDMRLDVRESCGARKLRSRE